MPATAILAHAAQSDAVPSLVELLDELRDRLWGHYNLQLHELVTGEVYRPNRSDDPDVPAHENQDF